MGVKEEHRVQVTLVPYSASAHRRKMRLWLARPHVARWWGDPQDALNFVDHHAKENHAVISVDGSAVGYICWQSLPSEEKAAASLTSLPDEHVDIDLFIGEPDLVGRGIGAVGLRILIGRLEQEGVPSIGLAAAHDNPRALRAYEKAGFLPFKDFVEDGQRMHYLRRVPRPA